MIRTISTNQRAMTRLLTNEKSGFMVASSVYNVSRHIGRWSEVRGVLPAPVLPPAPVQISNQNKLILSPLSPVHWRPQDINFYFSKQI